MRGRKEKKLGKNWKSKRLRGRNKGGGRRLDEKQKEKKGTERDGLKNGFEGNRERENQRVVGQRK